MIPMPSQVDVTLALISIGIKVPDNMAPIPRPEKTTLLVRLLVCGETFLRIIGGARIINSAPIVPAKVLHM